MPKWAKLALYGAAIAVTVDYFIGPTLRDSLKLR